MILDVALPTPARTGSAKTPADTRSATTRPVIECVYDAVADPAQWKTVLAHLKARFHTQVELLFFADTEHGEVELVQASGIAAGFVEKFHTFARDEPWLGNGHERRGLSLKECRFYTEWMRPQGLEYSLGMMSTEAGCALGIALLRPAARGPFAASETAAFNRLRPHFRRTARLALRLGAFSGSQPLGDAATFLLDADPVGLVLLDSQGRTLHRNAAAIAMAADGIHFTDRGPRLTRQADDAMLQKLIAAALDQNAGDGAMTALRPSGKRPYAIAVTPLPVQGTSSRRAAVCIAISDPEAKPALPPARLYALYGLSQSEAALAICLA